jgi:exonuclease SbcC
MRPLQLSFSGIRSYAGHVGPLDFVGKSSVAIVGDTGAGQSTILEAITLGLYGNSTWTGGGHKELMAEGAAQMTVDFTFIHDNQRWRVRRVFHANTTPSTHLLENLDTAEHTDNARPVNRKIEALLQLDYDSFKSAVLLPQGKFDQLLTATGSERTRVLKSIFGVQALETMRERAGRHHDQLTELTHQAEIIRGRLLDDPESAAAAAATAAGQAEHQASYLNQALGNLRDCHEQATAARDRHAKLSAAGASLDDHKQKDVPGELARITGAVSEVADLEARDASTRRGLEKQQQDVGRQLSQAAQEGITPESLAAAATILDGVPSRLEELEADRAQLAKDEDDIAGLARQIEDATGRLGDLQELTSTLTGKRDDADRALEQYRQVLERLQDTTGTALRAAAKAGQGLRQESQALAYANDLQQTLSRHQNGKDRMAEELQAAEGQLADIHSHDAAHAAGAGLTAGEPCLICRRPLPDDYLPPAPADPDTLNTAKKAVRKARKAADEASDDLARAQAEVAAARQQHEKQQLLAQQARTRLDRASRDAAAAMQDLARQRRDDGNESPGEPGFGIRLQHASMLVAEADADDDDELVTVSARELLSPARTVEQGLAEASAIAQEALSQAKADADRAENTLSHSQQAHGQAQTKLAVARKRQQTARTKLDRDLETLPPLLRRAIPGSSLAVTPGHITSARNTVTERQEQLDALRRQREKAAGDLAELDAAQRQLDQRRSREVDAPLQNLATYLERWQDVMERVVTVLPVGTPSGSPARPAAVTADTVSTYAAALAQAEVTVRDSLATVTAAAGEEARNEMLKLTTAAARLRSGQQGIPAIDLTDGQQLLQPAALDRVVAAEAQARQAARRHRDEQTKAQEQIQQAGDLDTAITAGKARLGAVDALRALLADGKFLQYLTDRRTLALLGAASEIFGRLSGGEFGFADEFQIISRRSRVIRSPKTLSGGETFLASLALALALVEMHSRTGATLGALFLDEGFAALDADALASSLAVLQAEAGGDKLVAVVSHLHAVAEAVEDVMWVERNPEGSRARWLTAAERDELVREEVASGLLTLV